MLLQEFWKKEPEAYQDLEQDNSQITKDDLRKTRLTLRQLNKLRKMNDVRSVEYKEKLKKIRQVLLRPWLHLALLLWLRRGLPRLLRP